MGEDVLIRDYQSRDYPQLLGLWQELGLASAKRGDDELVIDRTLRGGGRLLLLCLKKTDEIIGSSWLTVDGRRTYLHHFGISQRYQGQGLANLLLKESLKTAKKIGFQVKLEVERNNIAARNLYLKFGFQALGDYEVLIIRDLERIKIE